jgi:UDP-glucose 4-epimerase
VAIVRLFSLYGIGLRKQLLWDACSKISHDDTVFSGTGDELRDWLHVDDAARLLLIAGQESLMNPLVVNGGTAVGVSTHSVVSIILNSFHNSQKIHFSGVSRIGDPPRLVANITEALALGWRPKRVLKQELELYVEWFKLGSP